ncbi:hypothetical protein BJ138DRAFT_1008912 [Hygrophoropsis aurantiaca]|uniref:Uncharacterized protein n=1 Tax=Hygrophoropsis aurantiaca TaxID=72124 RepID=A0ACB8ACA2_9AGAM|nr:hypothetical protein BJ138DRAFT_1008912 [Hygrophoropsis aurantiaca]
MSVLVATKFPSVAAVFLACAASILLLFLARIAYAFMRIYWSPIATSATGEKVDNALSKPLWSWTKAWNPSWSMPLSSVSLPFTLILDEESSTQVGAGIGVGLRRSDTLPVNWKRRQGPQFQPPLPALYENPMPLSMAKIIMSRHTFRRPNPNRPRRMSTVSNRPPIQLQTQPTSRLHHSNSIS